jgi:hypothetical protein
MIKVADLVWLPIRVIEQWLIEIVGIGWSDQNTMTCDEVIMKMLHNFIVHFEDKIVDNESEKPRVS